MYASSFLRISRPVRPAFPPSVVARLSVPAGRVVVVGVGTCPLHVDQIRGRDPQVVGNEAVFDAGINLNDVPAFPLHVQVDDATS